MNDSQPPPISGLVAGKYAVSTLIGRGGMGSVWEGRHTSLGTRVAIKFIDPEYAESKEAQTRFVTEARAAATLQSKHAIQIFDHGVTDDGRPYMVMELLDGEPLDRRIDRLGRMTLGDTARVLVQVCRALQRAHAAGIIHRDLKPENIFIVRSPDDDEEIAKVLDFGIAKIKAGPGEMGLSTSTKTGAVLGTPYYMAPEQARGLRSIDYRADLWSLGVIAYKCVIGALPFEGESVGDLLVKICTAPPPRPSSVLPILPPAFDVWFARALQREPEGRFQTAQELADALALAAGLPIRQKSSTGGDGLSNQSGNVTPMSLQVTPATTPVPGAGVTSAPFVTSAAPPKKSSRMFFVVALTALLGGTIGVLVVAKILAPRPPVQPPVTAAAIVAVPPTIGTASVAVGLTLPALTIESATASVTPPPPTVAPRPRPGGGAKPVPTPGRPASPKPSPPPSDPGY